MSIPVSTRFAEIAACLALVGCCGPGYDMTAWNDEPLKTPVVFRPGEYSFPAFVPNTSGEYTIRLYFQTNPEVVSLHAVRCVMGRPLPPGTVCPEGYERARLKWEVFQSGTFVARGDTYRDTDLLPPELQRQGYGLPIDQGFGSFPAKEGEWYVLRLHVENDSRDFNKLAPTLAVTRSVPGLCAQR
jgi:hypothetical protein